MQMSIHLVGLHDVAYPFKTSLVYSQRQINVHTNGATLLVVCSMLPRNMRFADMELPGVGSKDVPLIGYRPLQSETDSCREPLRKQTDSRNSDSPQVDSSPMKTTWYCPLDLSTVSEKEEDGVIYTVVVKPQAGGSSSTAHSGLRSEFMKAGTEEKLVLHLLHSFSTGDTSYVSVFLATYRSFTTTQRVLDILADRLENPPGASKLSANRLAFNTTVCSVFSKWLDEYKEDFLSLGDPTPILRLAPLLPSDPSGSEIRKRLLKISEELSERTLLSDSPTDSISSVTSPSDSSNAEFDATKILGFPADVVAEQLTMIETDLFLHVVPYHCLGSLWSQRDKKGREGVCLSVRATVRQFNRLAKAVTASCLWHVDLRTQQRARLLEKWISVAEECRTRKNFSSVYAIVSALQSNPLHRLRKTWAETDREALRRYEELSDIFSEKDNYSQSRELLREEETSQLVSADTKTNNRKQTGTAARGTVPYLGIFLTDLMMLDTAVKDRLENGYIHFDKRRREFEVLSQIKLLQTSCKSWSFTADESFLEWYYSVPTLSEEESYRLSNQIESASDPSPGRALNPTVVITHCTDILTSVVGPSIESEAVFDFPSPVNHLLSKLAKHMKSPSVSCLDVDSSPPPTDPALAPVTPVSSVRSHRRSVSCGNPPTSKSREAGPDMRIIRIRMDLQDGNLYRSIMVTSNDKTPSVISNALEKHNQDPKEAPRYELIQLQPDGKELKMPPAGNVFYAMTSSSVDFLLRRQGGSTPLGSPSVGTETSATFPRIKAKGRRLVRTLF
ncbi:ral guanine nucleotide dissociation stimulator-like 2 isoform X2 [Brienomyrus brachyistius]|uniref:ral guanine nucleotide dissociation stimulator-like 2 isoform X2 n=1 Tax=Brienomyrus brachyistius TaxID=42636 RepID=UPI0020B42157|nr:ral guanine nucleotide dissociation stimulator-like 2 isoform X2 [Brienomyrus brachyistius]